MNCPYFSSTSYDFMSRHAGPHGFTGKMIHGPYTRAAFQERVWILLSAFYFFFSGSTSFRIFPHLSTYFFPGR